MLSMTGFGSSKSSNEKYQVYVEIKGVNNRYLDFVMNMPSFLNPLENDIKDRLKTKISRGRVDVNIKFLLLEEYRNLYIDKNLVKQYSKLYSEVIKFANIENKISLTDIIKNERVIIEDDNINIEDFRQILFDTLDSALDEFIDFRAKEGKNTFLDIKKHIDFIEDNVKFISTFENKIEKKFNEQLSSKLEENLASSEFTKERILSETAIMLVKYSMNEEISRLHSHIEAFKTILNEDKPIGKKLDFLSQEINREINTCASKSLFSEINFAVVEMKDSLENIREQLRNIE